MKSKEGDVISLRSWQAKPNNERQFIDRLIAYGRPSVLAQRTLARERTRRRFHRRALVSTLPLVETAPGERMPGAKSINGISSRTRRVRSRLCERRPRRTDTTD